VRVCLVTCSDLRSEQPAAISASGTKQNLSPPSKPPLSRHSGGIGAPPGTTRVPARSWLTVRHISSMCRWKARLDAEQTSLAARREAPAVSGNGCGHHRFASLGAPLPFAGENEQSPGAFRVAVTMAHAFSAPSLTRARRPRSHSAPLTSREAWCRHEMIYSNCIGTSNDLWPEPRKTGSHLFDMNFHRRRNYSYREAKTAPRRTVRW
jgi:hypothetical protein